MTEPAVEHEGDGVVIRVPMRLQRRHGRKEVVVPQGLGAAREKTPAAQGPLFTALARAFDWQELIESGRFSGVSELAEVLGMDRSYVRRIMDLALLAPGALRGLWRGGRWAGFRWGRWRTCQWSGQSHGNARESKHESRRSR